ncbi:Lrp/AsnC family transcriptional regulator [Parafrankia discariae]|uniref:Lrp/AsnC family transcriptional regulator n=1 Tax=Parafrankia discariae TaxID=365528 RepID=UPI00037F4DEC|nr:AsnC family transcriptional regulator [Parafrankia discariae]
MTTAVPRESDTTRARHVVTDPDDLRIIRALQLAPRAPFARIAAVLCLPERTVARRYGALRRDGILRIFGILNPATTGEHPWSVRVHCRPDSAEALAAALARRDDIAWVVLSAGGSEVTFAIRSLSAEQRDTLLTRRLPRAAHVLSVEASVLLHYFVGQRSDDWGALAGYLGTDETAALRVAAVPSAAAPAPRPVPLEPADEAIAAVLARDGRASYAELAAAAGMSEGRVTRRLGALLQSGTMHLDMDLAMTRLGYNAKAHLYMGVSPARLHETGQALADLPEVAFAAARSGRHNLVASVVCRDLADLYAFTTRRVGQLDGIQTLEISPVFRTVKQSGAWTDDGRLVEPPLVHRPRRQPA